MNKEIVIIGSGISGLSAAYYLNNKGKSFTILEAESYAGGILQTEINDGYIIEKGPNTILLSDKRTEEMFNDLNLKIENASPKSKKRFIVKNKKCVPLPLNLWQLLSTKLFSMKSKLNILMELLNRKIPISAEESISQFIIRRFGKEILDYTVNPFIAGTYAGDPDSLSIEYAFPRLYKIEKKYNTIIGGFLKERKNKQKYKIKPKSISFQGGIGELTKSLSNKFNNSIHYDTKVININQIDDHFEITYKNQNKTSKIKCSKVICTLPTFKLKNITINNAVFNEFLELANIDYPPVISTSLVYNSSDIPHSLDGFGVLVPKCENMNILGVLFPTSSFKNRAPKNESLLTVFMGGARNPEKYKLSTNERLDHIYADLKILLGISVKPILKSENIWDNSIPQYKVGYGHFKSIFNIIEAKLPGLYLSGNYINGISIQDSILTNMNLVNQKF